MCEGWWQEWWAGVGNPGVSAATTDRNSSVRRCGGGCRGKEPSRSRWRQAVRGKTGWGSRSTVGFGTNFWKRPSSRTRRARRRKESGFGVNTTECDRTVRWATRRRRSLWADVIVECMINHPRRIRIYKISNITYYHLLNDDTC